MIVEADLLVCDTADKSWSTALLLLAPVLFWFEVLLVSAACTSCNGSWAVCKLCINQADFAWTVQRKKTREVEKNAKSHLVFRVL